MPQTPACWASFCGVLLLLSDIFWYPQCDPKMNHDHQCGPGSSPVMIIGCLRGCCAATAANMLQPFLLIAL